MREHGGVIRIEVQDNGALSNGKDGIALAVGGEFEDGTIATLQQQLRAVSMYCMAMADCAEEHGSTRAEEMLRNCAYMLSDVSK